LGVKERGEGGGTLESVGVKERGKRGDKGKGGESSFPRQAGGLTKKEKNIYIYFF